MPTTLILGILATIVGTLDVLVQRVSTWMTVAFLVSIDIWVIVIVIGSTVIIIIVIVIRTSRRQ